MTPGARHVPHTELELLRGPVTNEGGELRLDGPSRE
jgi:hypothetical protein